MRVRANRRELEWLPAKKPVAIAMIWGDATSRGGHAAISRKPWPGAKLIGYTVDEASDVLDNIWTGPTGRVALVRIVHGKGSGILRKSIRDALHDHPLVKSFQRAGDNEGGDGVTVAMLVN